jgi:hypothetical protein
MMPSVRLMFFLEWMSTTSHRVTGRGARCVCRFKPLLARWYVMGALFRVVLEDGVIGMRSQ